MSATSTVAPSIKAFPPPTPANPRLPKPPGPRGRFFWGSLPDLQRDMLGLYRSSAREFGDVVTLRFAGYDTFTVSHPDHFKYVLQDNNKNYGRNPFVNDVVKLFTGVSLFTADGADWLSRRRLMARRRAARGEVADAAR